MNLLAVLCGFLLIGGVLGEKEDASYECLKNAIEKMSNSSCPLITPEVERDIDEYARLYTACTKGHYLINGCNESEWVQACNRRVANIPPSSSSSSLRGMQDIGPMRKYCNEGIIDPDFDCFNGAEDSINNITCPWLTQESIKNDDDKTLITKSIACYKTAYVKQGCRENQWNEVCNKIADRLNVGANGGQHVVDFYRNMCNEKDKGPSYICFESAIAGMDEDSCPEVAYAKTQNETTEEIGRHQSSCFKRLYLNNYCKIYDWKEVCELHSFSFKTWDERNLMRGYCNL